MNIDITEKDIKSLGQPSNTRPLLSIGLPFYNAEEYIQKAITSILAQTYTNWELILINDGSTDESLLQVKKFTDPRITLISDGENKGLSHRLNESVDLSNGEFYVRMDADDIMISNRLEIQLQYMINHPEYHVIGAGAYIIDNKDQVTGMRYGNPFDKHDFQSVLENGGFIHPSVFGRTAWFKTNPYDATAERCEDIELWLRTVDHSHFGQITEPLLFYREDGDQAVKVKKTSMGYIKILRKMLSTAKPEYRSSLRKKLMKSYVKIQIRRVAHALGLENRIVSARSQSVTQIQRQAAEVKLQQALANTQAGG
ncbi:glycosyltransferase family 2 protein [Deinococcus sp. UR1]|uniref:glycosyltransferase family 2 protein n=1 Tax=Deinococcus sp. UR1 TaxID=1704277 RepID=UPI000ABD7775|nr:glycosyltransferase family A protein [Deinococcus sp. UR1]PIG99080.1 glycosyl transferase family 2 [Deinococcus sp. UR1]